MGLEPFRLRKDVVARLVGLAKRWILVFDGRAVARANPLDHAGIRRRAIEVVAG